VPQFWLGLLLIVVLALQLHWLPTPVVGTPAQLIMPVITWPARPGTAGDDRAPSMIDELNQQYVKTCFAKGLSFYRVVGVHACETPALPVVTLCGWELIGGGGLTRSWWKPCCVPGLPHRHPGHRTR